MKQISVGMLFPLGQGEGRAPDRMVRATGEYRPPKKNEWYLSGAIVEGYEARADMTRSYHIAQLVEVETITQIKVVKVLTD